MVFNDMELEEVIRAVIWINKKIRIVKRDSSTSADLDRITKKYVKEWIYEIKCLVKDNTKDDVAPACYENLYSVMNKIQTDEDLHKWFKVILSIYEDNKKGFFKEQYDITAELCYIYYFSIYRSLKIDGTAFHGCSVDYATKKINELVFHAYARGYIRLEDAESLIGRFGIACIERGQKMEEDAKSLTGKSVTVGLQAYIRFSNKFLQKSYQRKHTSNKPCETLVDDASGRYANIAILLSQRGIKTDRGELVTYKTIKTWREAYPYHHSLWKHPAIKEIKKTVAEKGALK